MSEPSSAHCLSDMWLANDSMMSRRSGWLRERRFGNLETFKEKKNKTEEQKEIKTLPKAQLMYHRLPPATPHEHAGQSRHGWAPAAWAFAHNCGAGKQKMAHGSSTRDFLHFHSTFRLLHGGGGNGEQQKRWAQHCLSKKGGITIRNDNSAVTGCRWSPLLKSNLGSSTALDFEVCVCFCRPPDHLNLTEDLISSLLCSRGEVVV